jgi:hypothetical protein
VRQVLVGGVLLLLSLSGLAADVAASASTPSAKAQKHATATCTKVATGHKTVTKDQIAACASSSLTLSHPCPNGSNTVFVVIRNRNYALRVGHTPEHLPKQYGMGTITQACGVPRAAPVAPTTTAVTEAPAPTTTTVPPPSPTTAAPASCYPLTVGGNCYEPGEYCRSSDHGVTGRAGNGEAIVCQDNNGWRWEPA